ncbi:MAG: helix-turn-helix domain-containing protein [Thermoprotei archaeon]
MVSIKEIIINVRMPIDYLVSSLINNGVPVRILKVKQFGPYVIKETIELGVPINKLSDIISKLKENPNVLSVKILYSDSTKVLVNVVGVFNEIYKIFANFDVFISVMRNLHDGWSELVLIIPNNKILRKILKQLHEIGMQMRVKSITYARNKTILTPKQDSIIRIAYELGYYDFPRKTNLTSLAKKLNLSSATLSEILRRGEYRIISYYITSRIN